MPTIDHQSYAASQLLEGFLRRGMELGAKSETIEKVMESLLAIMAVYRAPPGKEGQYIKSFLLQAMANVTRMSDVQIEGLKKCGQNPISAPDVADFVRSQIR